VLLWSGIGQAMLLGPVADPIDGVAMTEQSNSWAMLRLEGEGARDVLARLTPLDLRPSAMAVGHTARSLLGHMNALFHRSGEDAYDILVFRSMTASAVHDLTRAMRGVAARSAL
jgi:sarcosine oxidase subunit gamma